MIAYVCAGRESTLKDHLRWPLLNIVITSSIGGCLVGLNKVFLRYLLPWVKADLGLDKNIFFEAIIWPLSNLARVNGMVIAVFSMDYFGRRNTIYWAAIMLAFGTGISRVFPCIQTMMIGRYLVVAAADVVAVTIPVYMSEATPYRVRGMIMSFIPVPEAIGQVLGHGVIAGLNKESGNWRIFVLMETIIGITYIYAMFTLSETPRFLFRQAHVYMDIEKHNKAVDLVRRICPPQDAEHEVYSLQSGMEEEMEAGGSLLDVVRCAWSEHATRSALLTWLLCTSFPHLCGINVLGYLTSDFTRSTGISKQFRYLHGSFIVCLLKMTGSAMGACFLDVYEISRKDVLQVCFAGMITAYGTISVLLHGHTDLFLFYESMVIGAIILCAGSFFICQGTVAAITEEACPNRFRGIGAGAALINSFICKHITADFTHLIYTTWNAASVFSALFMWNLILLGLVWRYVPRTPAMPLEFSWMTLKDLKRFNDNS